MKATGNLDWICVGGKKFAKLISIGFSEAAFPKGAKNKHKAEANKKELSIFSLA